jgi:hypothetical protein
MFFLGLILVHPLSRQIKWRANKFAPLCAPQFWRAIYAFFPTPLFINTIIV